MQNRDRLFYQYALMNLAVLQAEFGCYTEAVDAMLQTVSTARENRDMTCLNFALNWLFHFGRAHPALVRHIDPASTLGSAKETLAFLRVRAKETGMWTLWSSVLLSEAKLALSNGESVATALENVVRSSQVIVERNARAMFAPHLMLVASLWDRLGLSALSAATCEVALRAHAPHGVFEDELRLACRLAMDLAGRGRYDDALRLLDDKVNPLDEASGVSASMSPPSASSSHQALRAEKTQQYWRKHRGIIKLRRDLAREDLDGASDLLSQLLQSKFDDLEPDMALSIDLLHVDYLVRRGDLSRAFSLVEDLLSRTSDDVLESPASNVTSSSSPSSGNAGDTAPTTTTTTTTNTATSTTATTATTPTPDISHRIRLLLAKASLYIKANQPSRAFSLATRAASLSHRARLLPLLWRSVAVLSAILTSLSEFTASARLLSAALPRALEYDDAHLAASLYSALADAEVGLAGLAGSNPNAHAPLATPSSPLAAAPRPASSSSVTSSSPPFSGSPSRARTEHLTHATEALDRAFKYYSDVGEARAAREVIAKRAAIMKILGDKALAAQYSAKYVALLEKEDARRKGVQVAGRS